MSSYQEFPKWLYHPTLEARMVPDRAAQDALGPGWFENPGEAKAALKPEPKPEAKPAKKVK